MQPQTDEENLDMLESYGSGDLRTLIRNFIMYRFLKLLFGLCFIFLVISCKPKSYSITEESEGVSLSRNGKVILKVLDDENSIKLNIRNSEIILNLEDDYIISGLLNDPSVKIMFNSSEKGVLAAEIKDKRNCGVTINFPYDDDNGSYWISTPKYETITNFDFSSDEPFAAHQERINSKGVMYYVNQNGVEENIKE